MKLALALGVAMSVLWAVGAVLIGIKPHSWGGGLALSMLTGMAFGGVISLSTKLLRRHR